ncbi:coronin-2B-like isoform X2 [Frankliniella occidentalis]|uniref:Coronin n=1 Tax=Frankliniella occidentalis TaxID=133901 RepID=A0A9C6WYX3_FRAOC|nr:coronin-2B-like isoform X2 [Frankliniella occidentalis]
MVDVRACAKPQGRLWFRGIRSSKFRHVYGAPAKRDRCYENMKITKNAHDSQFCAVNPKFVAVVTEVAGGGAFLVLPIDHTGRLDFNTSRVTGHRGPVLDIKWNPFNDNIIASCSDDCTIKLWYIPDTGLSMHLTDWLIDLHGHKRRVGYIEWHPTAENILVSAGFDHLMIVWDIGRGEAITVIDCHPDVIYCMSFNRDGSYIATTCKDKKLRVIDPRTGIVKSEGMCHAGMKASKVTYLGSTGRLLTTGFSRHSDRQLAVWSQDNLSQPLTVENVDSSSGVLFPYYDHDTRIVFLAGKGDGNIRYYEIVDEAPWLHYLNQFLSGSPQRGLGFMPKRGCEVSHCEIFRFYKLHTTKGMCEPVSMIVPRKSDQFQDDLFPDTAAPVPAMTAAEWITGKNSMPVLMSMKTGVTIRTHKPKVYKPGDNVLPIMAENNIRKKFAFLSQETVPDYRTVDKAGSMDCLDSPSPLHQVTVPPVPDLLDNGTGTSRSILQMLSPVDEKSQKTSNNQTTKFQQIQQMFSGQVNNVNHTNENTLNYKKTSPYGENREKEKEREKEANGEIEHSPKNLYQLQRAYSQQCEELKLLRKQVVARDRRIQELEQQIAQLTGAHTPLKELSSAIQTVHRVGR